MAGSIEVTPVTSGRTVEELRESVVARGRNLSTTMDLLGARIERAVDWRRHLSRHPWLLVSVAAGAGLVATRLLRRRAAPSDRALAGVAAGLRGVADGLQGSSGAARTPRSSLRGLIGRGMLAFLVRAATRRASGSRALYPSRHRPSGS
jgi:hypothetical protein